ncbi:MAG: Rpn family recombination-promoting nuclease/putative transposase [Komarekiella atlantica HA4396-MV6]|nr:Rpn family recombination-promoting nuclease/putative transposase [Komarekiella atlantica HA4396-MV6]
MLSLVSEIFLYLRQHQPRNLWQEVVIYPSKNIDINEQEYFLEFFLI